MAKRLPEADAIYDSQCKHIINTNVSMTVPWYLMAAYAYYEDDRPILSDAMFDYMAAVLLENWDSIIHMHKHLIDRGNLKAGTLLLAEEKYPSMVKDTVHHIREKGVIIHG